MDRKTAVEDSSAHKMGFDAQDVELSRLRIMASLSELVKAEIAKAGDMSIAIAAEDEDAVVIPRGETLRVYVLSKHTNYDTKFNGTEGGPWEEGDEMPEDASMQYNYMFYVPSFSKFFPIKYTASSTAAREGRKLNTRLAVAEAGGVDATSLCIGITTKVNTKKHTWYTPLFSQVEPDADEVANAIAIRDRMFGPARAQIAAETETAPTY